MFNHPNMARRALKNVALGMPFILCKIICTHDGSSLSDFFYFYFLCLIAYLASLEDQEFTNLALDEYKTATNMTEQFAALAAIAQNPGKTRDDVLADFYGKWQHDFLVNLSLSMNSLLLEINLVFLLLSMLPSIFRQLIHVRNCNSNKLKVNFDTE